MNADEWRNRPTYSRILIRCDHCGELREGVEKRKQFWPFIELLSCLDCYRKAVVEASGTSIC